MNISSAPVAQQQIIITPRDGDFSASPRAEIRPRACAKMSSTPSFSARPRVSRPPRLLDAFEACAAALILCAIVTGRFSAPAQEVARRAAERDSGAVRRCFPGANVRIAPRVTAWLGRRRRRRRFYRLGVIFARRARDAEDFVDGAFQVAAHFIKAAALRQSRAGAQSPSSGAF